MRTNTTHSPPGNVEAPPSQAWIDVTTPTQLSTAGCRSRVLLTVRVKSQASAMLGRPDMSGMLGR